MPSHRRSLTLGPLHSLAGEVQMPGSKSISNRILLLAALAKGRTRVRNLLRSEDTERMLNALQKLGVAIAEDGQDWLVEGAGGPLATDGRKVALHLGLAGTALRPLTAALALGRGEFLLDGVPRMRERPIAPLVDALRRLGADIEYAGTTGYPPIRVRGTGLRGGRVDIDGSLSSQFLSALLLAAPLAAGPLAIRVQGPLVSRPYIDLNLELMQRFGVFVAVEEEQRMFRAPAAGYHSPGQCLVEGDASSATYFLAAGAVRGKGIRVRGVGADSIQGDLGFADVLRTMGAQVRIRPAAIEAAPGPKSLIGIAADCNRMPDAAMTLAVLALFARGRTRIDNIGNWRLKETDRLAAMARELRKLGAEVEEGPDYLAIAPPEALQPAAIDTYGDHRMAMSFSLAALGGVPVTIKNPDCVAKTFPDYFKAFSALANPGWAASNSRPGESIPIPK